MAKGKEIIRGRSGAPGTVVVTVRVVNGDKAKMHALNLSKKDGIVGTELNPEHNDIIAKVGAMIMDVGGPTAHHSIQGKTLGIPTVTATQVGTDVLKEYDGKQVVVEGMAGYEPHPVTGEPRPYGAVYEYVPDVPGAASAAPSQVAAKLGVKLPPSVLEKLAQLQKKG